MNKVKAPVFIAAPRSRSTALQTLASPFAEKAFNLRPLGQNTEFFNQFSWRNFSEDNVTGRLHATEYFPINREEGISHHYVYPPIYKTALERSSHKVRVLRYERERGRNYNVKIMAENLLFNISKDGKKIARDKMRGEEILDLFRDRHFVITRRRDIKGLAFSLLVATHTKLWHKRKNNENLFDELYNDPIYINPELCTAIIPSLEATAAIDQVEDFLEKRNYTFTTLFYEDLSTLEDMKYSLDLIFQTKNWRDFASDEYLESSMPRPLNLDYSKIISNYDAINNKIDMTLKTIFE